MNSLTKTIVLTLTASAALGAHALDLSDFVLTPVRPLGIPATQPALDGNFFYQFSDNRSSIYRIDYKTGRKQVTVFDSSQAKGCDVADWDGYKMSADERKILLWNDTRMIYRRSFTADYWVYDMKSKSMARVSSEGGEQIATMSPDGQKVAYVKANNIYVKDLASGATIAVTTDGEKNKIINGATDWVYEEEFVLTNTLNWSPDSRTLAFVRFDESQVPMASMTLYQGDCTPNDSYETYPGTYNFKYPVAGEKNSVVSVWAFDLANQELRKMNLPIGDDDYIPHLDYAQDNSKLMVSTLNRLQNDFHIYAVNPATGSAESVYHEVSKSWIDSEMMSQVAYFDHWFVLPSDKTGRMQLYWISLDGKQEIQFTKGDEVVTDFYGFDEKHQRFYFQTTAGPLNRQVKYIDDKGATHSLTPAQGTYSARFSSNYDYYIRTFSDAETPTQYVIYSTAANKPVRELQMNREYAEKYTAPEIPKREFITVESDGYKLNGYIIKPAHFAPASKYPVIMVQYSGPGSQQVANRWYMDWVQYAAMQGYVVACVDGRGTGFRGTDFERVVYQRLGYYESIDQIAAANYMASLPYVDKDRIGIWGWSYGGYEALMAMSTPGSNYRCGVAIAPVTSWKFYDTIYAERFMRTPQLNPEGYTSSAPLEVPERLKGKVLIMFGSADDNVHIVNSMQYIAKLQGLHTDFDMMVWTNMNHSINGCDVRLPLYRKVLDFFNLNLKK